MIVVEVAVSFPLELHNFPNISGDVLKSLMKKSRASRASNEPSYCLLQEGEALAISLARLQTSSTVGLGFCL